MNSEIFERIATAQTLLATGPFVAISVGVLLLVLIEALFPNAGAEHGPHSGASLLKRGTFLATIAVAAYYAILTLSKPSMSAFEGTYVANSTTAWWSLLFLAATAIAWIFGLRYYREEARYEGEHTILMLCACAGMVLMAGSRDLLVFFIGLELLSVPLYALAGFRRAHKESVEAGLKYFVLGAFAAGVFLFGAALVYAGTGTLTLGAMKSELLGTPLVIAGATFVMASLFFKVSVFPFHLWVPDVYQGSPSPVTTLMATGTKAAGFAFLLPASFLLPPAAASMLGVIALFTLAAGNFGALVQTDLKRMLAYSSIAHAGTLLLAVAAQLASPREAEHATQAVLFYMAAYVFTAGGSFGLLTLLEGQSGKPVTVDSIRGLAKRRPGMAAAMALFMLSLGGIPATGGFFGKYFVFAVAIRADMIVVSVIAVLLSVVALGYYLRIVVAMYMQPETEGRVELAPARFVPGAMTLACAAMVLLLGLLPGWLLDRLG
jgi:NADH-quinone oxidoreductase subunit N